LPYMLGRRNACSSVTRPRPNRLTVAYWSVP
jgi:hypothetical protein